MTISVVDVSRQGWGDPEEATQKLQELLEMETVAEAIVGILQMDDAPPEIIDQVFDEAKRLYLQSKRSATGDGRQRELFPPD